MFLICTEVGIPFLVTVPLNISVCFSSYCIYTSNYLYFPTLSTFPQYMPPINL